MCPTARTISLPAYQAAEKGFEIAFGKKPLAVRRGGSIPIISARLGLPMVDCDGMGRAFPELQMVTFTIGGASATPMALTDEKGIRLAMRESLTQNPRVIDVTIELHGKILEAIKNGASGGDGPHQRGGASCPGKRPLRPGGKTAGRAGTGAPMKIFHRFLPYLQLEMSQLHIHLLSFQ